MKYLGLLPLICLLAFTSIHASALNPLTDGYTLNVDNTVLTNANVDFDGLTGVLTFSDATSTYTFLEASAPGLINALSITRTCVTVDLAGCSSSIVSVSDANVLNGTLQASALVGVTLQASAFAGVSDLVFAQTTVALGAQTALVGYPDTGSTSVTPEPSSLALLGTGMLGLAGAVRRRFGFV